MFCFQMLACITGDQTRDERWLILIFLLTGNSYEAHSVRLQMVNKGDPSICCFSQFRNKLLRILQGHC